MRQSARILEGLALRVLALAIVALLPLSAVAQDGLFYFGGGVGLQRSQASVPKFANPVTTCIPLSCRFESEELSYAASLFVGYEINPQLAVEFGYTDLGDTYRVTSVDPNFPAPTKVAVAQESEALFLRAVATFPLAHLQAHPLLDKMSVSAVGGLSQWRSRMEFNADLRGAGFGGSRAHATRLGLDFTFGARLNYDASEHIRVSLAWDRFNGLGKGSAAIINAFPTRVGVVNSDVDVFSLNLSYRFN